MHVERVEVKDVRLPKQLQRAMAAEAEANREAKAKVSAVMPEEMMRTPCRTDLVPSAPYSVPYYPICTFLPYLSGPKMRYALRCVRYGITARYRMIRHKIWNFRLRTVLRAVLTPS